MRSLILSILLHGVGMVVLSVPIFAQQGLECTIIGELHGPRGQFPNKRILVNLETRGAVVATAYADDEGKFQFAHLEGNLYHVTINDDEYLSVSESVALMPVTNPTTMLRIDLVPRSDPSAATAAPNRPGANAHMMDNTSGARQDKQFPGSNPYMVNRADFGKQLSGKALKEFDAGVKADQKAHPDDAISHYLKALKITPAFYPARNNLGTAYLNKGDFNAAEAQFAEVIQGNPSDAAAYFNMGNVQLVTKRYDEAGRTIQEGLQKQPNSALGLFLLGSILQHTNHAPEAEKHLRRALEIDPTLSKAHLALVNLYLQQQRSNDAMDELKQFLKTAPHDPFAPKAREVLNRLQAKAGVPAKNP
jgi:Flp pilus assembly protein TadD